MKLKGLTCGVSAIALIACIPMIVQAQGGNNALEFNGTNAYVIVNPSPMMDVDLSSGFTFEGWFILRTCDNADGMLIWNGQGIEFQLKHEPNSSRLNFGVAFHEDNWLVWREMEFDVVLGRWQHVAVIWDKYQSKLIAYVNGSIEQEEIIPYGLPWSNESYGAYLGIYGDLSLNRWYNGDMNQIRVSSGVRYTSNFIPDACLISEPTTIALWNMTEGAGTTLVDRSGYNRNGIIINATWRSLLPGAPIVTDIPNDEGGWVHVEWSRSALDDTIAFNPVTSYSLQKLGSIWEEVARIPAAMADSYTVDVPVDGVLVPGEPPPWVLFRVSGATADDFVLHTSAVDSGYSIDNLPMDAPVLELYDSPTSRFLIWQNPDVPEFKETCLYRGSAPGFIPDTPLTCTADTYFIETDRFYYWYKARSFDIHGNASEWSNEVVGQYPTGVPGAMPTVLRLYPNQPNPFNPMTTIKYDVPADGQTTLRIYDIRGALVRTLTNADLPRGSHQATWDGRDSSGRGMASGSYFARLEAGGRVETVRMILVR